MGDFIKIELGDNMVAYARVIVNGIFAFYKIDHPSDDNIELMEQIRKSEPIFRLVVNDSAVLEGRWKIFGYSPVEPEILANPPVFFRQDIVDPKRCWLITMTPGFKKPIAPEECVNMEMEAVWDDPEQVEDRLRDYLNGKPNKWAERLKVKL